jgi:hypothetical protein
VPAALAGVVHEFVTTAATYVYFKMKKWF